MSKIKITQLTVSQTEIELKNQKTIKGGMFSINWEPSYISPPVEPYTPSVEPYTPSPGMSIIEDPDGLGYIAVINP